MNYEVVVNDETYVIDITDDHILLNGDEISMDFYQIGSSALYSMLVNNESFEALVENQDDIWKVSMRGNQYEVTVVDERTRLLRSRSGADLGGGGGGTIKSPMPGLVVAIPVEIGQEVEKGDNIIILESMKMENELKSPCAGRVNRITVSPGDTVEKNQIMVVIV